MKLFCATCLRLCLLIMTVATPVQASPKCSAGTAFINSTDMNTLANKFHYSE